MLFTYVTLHNLHHSEGMKTRLVKLFKIFTLKNSNLVENPINLAENLKEPEVGLCRQYSFIVTFPKDPIKGIGNVPAKKIGNTARYH